MLSSERASAENPRLRRYYDYDTTYSERHDTSVRKNIKTLAGKATKRQA